MRDQPSEDPGVAGWCESCQQPCTGVWVDTGIGAYEYWGEKGVDVCWSVVSHCCGADVLDRDPSPACECCDQPGLALDSWGWCAACSAADEQDPSYEQNAISA